MSRAARLGVCVKAREEEERSRRRILREAGDRLEAAEGAVRLVHARLDAEADALASALGACPLDLGRMALHQAGLASLERRLQQAIAALTPLRAAVDQATRGLDAARVDRRVVEVATERARASEVSELERRLRIATDDVVASRAGRAAQEETR